MTSTLWSTFVLAPFTRDSARAKKTKIAKITFILLPQKVKSLQGFTQQLTLEISVGGDLELITVLRHDYIRTNRMSSFEESLLLKFINESNGGGSDFAPFYSK